MHAIYRCTEMNSEWIGWGQSHFDNEVKLRGASVDERARSNESLSDIRLREEDLTALSCSHDFSCQTHSQGRSTGRLGTVFVVDDDRACRTALRDMLQDDGYVVEAFSSAPHFLETYHPYKQRCLIVDALLPGLSGIDLIQRLRATGDPIPAIVVSGHADVSMAVRAMKVGAVDFVEKPVGREELLASVQRALGSFEEIARITEFLQAIGHSGSESDRSAASNLEPHPCRASRKEHRRRPRYQPANG